MRTLLTLVTGLRVALGALSGAAETAKTTLSLEGMTCGGCAAAVKLHLKRTEGVTASEVSYEHKSAEVTYDPAKVTPSDVIAPPYDVVGADAVKALHSRSPYNAAHLENPAGSERDRYAGAATLLAEWTKDGALTRDAKPAYYVYEQRAKIPTGTGGTRTVSRRCFFARTRLHQPEEGIVRFHEATMAGPRSRLSPWTCS